MPRTGTTPAEGGGTQIYPLKESYSEIMWNSSMQIYCGTTQTTNHQGGEVFPGATHGDSMSLLRVHPTRMSLSPTVVRWKVKVEQWLNIAAMSSWAGVAIGTEKRWCDCLICLHES
jgi:hypothetical protein